MKRSVLTAAAVLLTAAVLLSTAGCVRRCNLTAAAAAPQNVQIGKRSYLYAVKGGDTLRLDRYASPDDGQTLRPCLLFLFGGGFVGGTRDDARYLPFFRHMVEQGMVVVSIDYRLGLKALRPDNLTAETFIGTFMQALSMATEDLYDATRLVIDSAADWRIDPKRIIACGSSAGAITVLQGEYGLCNSHPAAQSLPSGFDYAGIISFAGAIFDTSADLQWQRKPAPMQLFHGDADSNVPYDVLRQGTIGFYGSQYIARQLTGMDVAHWFYSASGADHRIAIDPMNDNRYEIEAFLQQLVYDGERIMVDTQVTAIGAGQPARDFTLEDYIWSNFP